MTWTSRVERVVSAAHHNGPPGNKCRTNHGHDWEVLVEFTYDKVGDYGWGPDFGKIKKIIDGYDHKDLNEEMPEEWPPSAELFAQLLFESLEAELGVAPDFVQVGEGNGNHVLYKRS